MRRALQVPFHLLGIAALLLVQTSEPAHAYIDPGTGSAIASAIVGMIAAVGYTFRTTLYKIKKLLPGASKQTDEKN